jgi:HlyD family secretion protein
MGKETGAGVVKWLVIVAVVALAGAGIWRWKHPPVIKPDYKTAEITRGEVVQTVTATGQLNPMTNVQVGCQISGIVDKIFVDYNSRVTNGELIARIEPTTYQATVAQAAGDVSNAEATLELSTVETKRADALYKASLISRSDFDKAVADLHQSQANLLIKQATLQMHQVDLDHTSIYAPVDGVVISRNVDVGQTVAASFSAPTLFVIANDLSKMQIDAYVSEADIGGIETNEVVNFTVDAYPTRTFHGTVLQVRNSPQTNQNVITYDTVIVVDNSDEKLKPGMTANVSVITAQTTNALKLPNAALRFHPESAETNRMSQSGNSSRGSGNGGKERYAGGEGGQPHGDHSGRTVYVPVKGPDGTIDSLTPVKIKTGINDGISTQVLEGLKEGDEVIVGTNLPSGEQGGPSNPFGMRRF